MLPSFTKIESNNPTKFKLILQKFLYENSFYSLDEYFELHISKIYLHMIQISIWNFDTQNRFKFMFIFFVATYYFFVHVF